MFDVRVMRWIDNHVGNLICSIIALGWVVTRPLRRRRSTVERIVVMKFFGLGSIVVSAAVAADARVAERWFRTELWAAKPESTG